MQKFDYNKGKQFGADHLCSGTPQGAQAPRGHRRNIHGSYKRK